MLLPHISVCVCNVSTYLGVYIKCFNMDKNEDKAINFLLGSEYFNGITFNGNFTINFNHFLIILNHFK